MAAMDWRGREGVGDGNRRRWWRPRRKEEASPDRVCYFHCLFCLIFVLVNFMWIFLCGYLLTFVYKFKMIYNIIHFIKKILPIIYLFIRVITS